MRRLVIVGLCLGLIWSAPASALTAKQRLILFSGHTLWTPLNLGSTLSAWWDAQDTADITLSSGNVASWKDRKGGIVASQGTGANQPAWSATALNNKAGVTCNGTTHSLSFTPTGLPSGSGASTIGLAGKPTVGGNRLILSFGANAGSQARAPGVGGNKIAFFTSGNDFNPNTGVDWVGANIFFEIMTAAGTNPAITTYADGVSNNSGSILTLNTGTSAGFICAFINGASLWTGIVQQIVVANSVLTTSQQQKLEGWESWYDGKAGSNLPASHPYKLRPPYASDP